jgi:hypothetical protein
MTAWSFAGVHGAPGVTTLALAVMTAWPEGDRPRVLVEADPAGGVLASRFDERLRLDRTLEDLAVAVRHGWADDTLAACARDIWPGHPAVVALPSAELVTATLRSRGDQLAAAIAAAPADVFVDVGRVDPSSPAFGLARRSVTTVVVCRDKLEDLAVVAAQTRTLAAAGVAVGLVIVRTNHPLRTQVPLSEFRDATGADLLGVLPWAPAHAGVFSGETTGRRWRRSVWWRAVSDLAAVMAGLDPTALPATPAERAANPTQQRAHTHVAVDERGLIVPMGGERAN